MIADDLAFRTFDAASARFLYELAAMRRTVQACQKREMVAGWALTGSNLADVGLEQVGRITRTAFSSNRQPEQAKRTLPILNLFSHLQERRIKY